LHLFFNHLGVLMRETGLPFRRYRVESKPRFPFPEVFMILAQSSLTRNAARAARYLLLAGIFSGFVALCAAPTIHAQAPTSREIPFNLVFTHLPFGSTQTITLQVWDAPSGGNLIFSEVHPNMKINLFGEIDFVLGSLTTGGIPTDDFPSGASRYLDVLDVTHRSTLLNGRMPMYGTAFSLTPGPAGPQGIAGPQGPQGFTGASGLSGSQGVQGPMGAMGPIGPQGPVGATGASIIGPTGATGAVGPQGPAGPVGISNRGAWSASNNYAVNDAVSDQGSFWLALVANNSCEPIYPPSPCSSNWQLLAAKGAPGAAGLPGLAGAQGLQGPMGFVGPMGPAGPMPTGAALVTTTNTFGASQTITGNLILSGVGAGVQFGDGTVMTSAAATGGGGTTPTGSVITSTSPVAPPGYTILYSTLGGGQWVAMPPLPTPRNGLAAVNLNGKIYAIGGSDLGNNPSKIVEVYDPGTNAWSTAASMPTARRFLAAAAVNGKIYAIGGGVAGAGDDTPLNIVEVYDPATNTWSAGPAMATARESLAAASVNGRLYAIGGSIPGFLGTVYNIVEVFDPATNTWSAGPGMATGRENLTATTLNGKIYAIGGTAEFSGPFSTAEVYDPVTNAWSAGPGLSALRCYMAAAIGNGKLYLIGGSHVSSVSQPTSEVDVYDPSTNSWSTATSLPESRAGLAAAEANGLIYAIGGFGGPQLIEQYSLPVYIYTFVKN
jgi:N-acetylneuraminic acid mutarotase